MAARRGYESEVGLYRAKAVAADPEEDPSTMVQELIARLHFARQHANLEGKQILDFGCGTGLALQWLNLRVAPARAVGIDVSEGAIAYARAKYPGNEYRVADLERPEQAGIGRFDVVLCFEVLEHLHDQAGALSRIRTGLLGPGGKLVLSTPNRLLFSLGMEPSPVNRTHVHELDYPELKRLMTSQFGSVRFWGMRFKDEQLTEARRQVVELSCEGYRRLGELWWNPWANRFYRYLLRGQLVGLNRPSRPMAWSASDFEFLDREEEIERDAIWFFAIAGNE